MEIKAVRGMQDLFGASLEQWSFVESRLRALFRAYGYGEIRTPVLEKIEVFSETVGDETDIVEKQMYKVAGDEKETYVLRPEETSACVRAIIEHQMHQSGRPLRLYYYLPMFRHERPQKGRLRQFHQVGAELVNDASPGADTEVIALLDQLYKGLGISEYEVRVNSVGCNDCRPKYKETLKDFLRPKLAQLCEQCQARFERSPLRILDCKKDSCKALLVGAPLILNHLCEPCAKHHAEVKRGLTLLGIQFEEDATIVRGLDYYTRTAFEFTSSLLGAQSALAGGGRYDGLSTRFGEKPFPAVGFALGMERLMIALEAKQALPTIDTASKFYFVALGEAAYAKLFPLSFRLKAAGISTDMNYDLSRSLKSALKAADKSQARWAVVLGEREIENKIALVKEMKTGTQEEISLDGLEKELMRRASLAP